MRFNGSDYNHDEDNQRLSNQYWDLFNCMRDGKRRTLRTIETITGYPPASISAQLRHMRKVRFGSNTVNKHHLGKGLYEYELIVNKESSE
jgi:hypothetical protein